MIYTDDIGRIHDQPTDGFSPSSNNGFLYTAVAKRLKYSLRVDLSWASICCFKRQRHPHYLKPDSPPMSRDEVLGLFYLLGDDTSTRSIVRDWYFGKDKPKLQPLRLIKQLAHLVDWKNLKLKHRNTFWKEGLDQIELLAYRVPLKDRHFLLKCIGKYSLIYHLIHVTMHLKQPKDRSARLLRFLKTGKDKESVANYFGPDHPLSRL